MENRIKAASMFSGIEGIGLGLQHIAQTVLYCEKDRECQRILRSNMEKGRLDRAPIYSYIKELSGNQLEGIDLLYGGSPCQQISNNNPNGEGLEGKDSSLFWEIARLVTESNPRYVFLENVANITNRGLKEIIRFFDQEGYVCEWLCLPASAIGAPHKRERWFFWATLSDTTSNRLISSFCDLQRGHLLQEKKFLEENKSKRNRGKPIVSSPYSINWERRDIKEQTQAWETEPSISRVDDGLSRNVAGVKATGNACVPLQARVAFEILSGFSPEQEGFDE